jgi:arginase
MSVNATIIGIPLDLGSVNLGVDIGPNALRQLKLKEKLESAGFEISDAGNIAVKEKNTLNPGNPKLKYLDEIVRVSQNCAKITERILKKKEKVIALGGDHSISLGTISGAAKKFDYELSVIYIDTHGDLNTDKTTPTGNIHGMHTASIMGFGNTRLTKIHTDKIKVKKENVIHIGGNDFDKPELELIKKEGIKCFTLLDLLSDGFKPLLRMIDYISTKTKNTWVSLDLDAVDSVNAPGVGIPNMAGLSYREITALADYIGNRCNVVGLDMVEYNPLKDIEGKTGELAIELIAKTLGSNYSWYTNYLKENKLR